MYSQKSIAEKKALFAHLLKREGLDRLQTITRRSDLREAPLSYAQRRLLFLQQLEPDSPAYNVPQVFRLTGKLNISVLERTLSEIVRRHEVLRTTFHVNGDEHLQVTHSSYDVSVPVIDLEHWPEVEREAEVQRFAVAEARHPFDLEHGPLLRAKLLRLGVEEHVVLFTLHHIVSDGWSTGLLVSEVQTLYTAYSEDRPSPLPELPIQYADYARWQRDWFKGAVFERQLAYWRERLRGAPTTLTLPPDRPRPAPRKFRGETHSVRFSAEVSGELRRISREQGTTLFMTMLAAFDILLSYYTKQTDIVIGTPVGGRMRAETEPLIGFFINTLVLRGDLSGDPTFLELLQRVKNDLLGALAHQDVPFEKLVEELQPERNLSYTPLFQVSFTLQKAQRTGITLPGLTLAPIGTTRGTTQYDLAMNLIDAEFEIAGMLEYDTDLYDGETILRMIKRFELLLSGLVASPSARLSELLAPLAAADAEQEKANEQQYQEFVTRKLAHTKRRGIRVS
ncbi:MAG TPA: condensation domain-containing protein [Pyrinomonadaceae bacterium]|nr:condensation domain-containing protein [Pyrinomonadaceae bacterium]